MFKKHYPENWFAVFVMTGEEDNVRDRLSLLFGGRLKLLVPKRRLRMRSGGIWKDESRILFPGYVLINGEVTPEVYYDIRHLPGIIKLLRSGNDLLEIEYYEMQTLSKLICNGEIIGYSDVVEENGSVRVINGPLASMEGIISRIDKRKGRAKVSIKFLGEERTIELGINLLQKTEAIEAATVVDEAAFTQLK